MCCQTLRNIIPQQLDVLEVIEMPPGLRDFLDNNISWLLKPSPLETPCSSSTDVEEETRGVKRSHSSEGDTEEEECAGPSRNKYAR